MYYTRSRIERLQKEVTEMYKLPFGIILKVNRPDGMDTDQFRKYINEKYYKRFINKLREDAIIYVEEIKDGFSV